MKRNKQVINGNVTGAGHGNPMNRYGQSHVPVASIPKKPVLPRQARRALRQIKHRQNNVAWPKWVLMSNPLYWMFHRVGIMVTPE